VENLIETAYQNTIDQQATRLRDSLAALTSIQNND
jgi:hypothetical protein